MGQIIKRMGAVTVLYFKGMGQQFKKLWFIITGQRYKNKPQPAQIEVSEVDTTPEAEVPQEAKITPEKEAVHESI